MPIDPRGIAVISGSGANFVDTKFRALDNGQHYFSGSLTISSSAAGGGGFRDFHTREVEFPKWIRTPSSPLLPIYPRRKN